MLQWSSVAGSLLMCSQLASSHSRLLLIESNNSQCHIPTQIPCSVYLCITDMLSLKGRPISHLVDLVWPYFGVPDKLLSMYSIRELILWPQVLPVTSFFLRLEHFSSKSSVLSRRHLLFFFLFLNPKKKKKKTLTCRGPSCGSDKQTKFADPPSRLSPLLRGLHGCVKPLEWVWTAPQSEAAASCRESASSLPPAASGERKSVWGLPVRRVGAWDWPMSAGNDGDSAAAFWFKKKKKIGHGLKEDNLCAKKNWFSLQGSWKHKKVGRIWPSNLAARKSLTR